MIFFWWILFAVVIAAFARSRGRSFFLYLILSLLLSPVIGLIIALISGTDTKRLERRAVARGKVMLCPFCAEPIQPAAVVCKHCGRDLPAGAKT